MPRPSSPRPRHRLIGGRGQQQRVPRAARPAGPDQASARGERARARPRQCSSWNPTRETPWKTPREGRPRPTPSILAPNPHPPCPLPRRGQTLLPAPHSTARAGTGGSWQEGGRWCWSHRHELDPCWPAAPHPGTVRRRARTCVPSITSTRGGLYGTAGAIHGSHAQDAAPALPLTRRAPRHYQQQQAHALPVAGARPIDLSSLAVSAKVTLRRGKARGRQGVGRGWPVGRLHGPGRP